jgi:cardiolipin synthase
MAFVGSANLNSRSLSFDYECNLMLIDRPSTLVLQQIFELDKQQRCHRLTPEYWRSFSRWKRWKGWLFHFLTPVV